MREFFMDPVDSVVELVTDQDNQVQMEKNRAVKAGETYLV
jgi:hypothetical protein